MISFTVYGKQFYIHLTGQMRYLQSRKDDISLINPVCPEDYFDANGQKIYFFTSIFKGRYHLYNCNSRSKLLSNRWGVSFGKDSFRWSFGLHFAWESKESRIILRNRFLTTDPNLVIPKKVIPHHTKSSTSNVQYIVRFYLITVNAILNVIYSLVDMMMAIATVLNIKIGLLTIIKIQEKIFINQLISRTFYSKEN